jgi:hypothetical protein
MAEIETFLEIPSGVGLSDSQSEKDSPLAEILQLSIDSNIE